MVCHQISKNSTQNLSAGIRVEPLHFAKLKCGLSLSLAWLKAHFLRYRSVFQQMQNPQTPPTPVTKQLAMHFRFSTTVGCHAQDAVELIT